MWSKCETNLKQIRSGFETNLSRMWSEFEANFKQIWNELKPANQLKQICKKCVKWSELNLCNLREFCFLWGEFYLSEIWRRTLIFFIFFSFFSVAKKICKFFNWHCSLTFVTLSRLK